MSGTMSRALRRSSVLLRAMGSSHASLALIISQLSELKSGWKSLQQCQSNFLEDLNNWTMKNGSDHNLALENVIENLTVLFKFWTDAQKEFVSEIKKFRSHFEILLEGEKRLDQAKHGLEEAKNKEKKLNKEYAKAPSDKKDDLSIKCVSASNASASAEKEVKDLVTENESSKMVRLKTGLSAFCQAHINMAKQCQVIFEGGKEVANQLPEVQGQELHEVTYSGSSSNEITLARVERELGFIKEDSYFHNRSSISSMSDAPPPYTENPPAENPYFLQRDTSLNYSSSSSYCLNNLSCQSTSSLFCSPTRSQQMSNNCNNSRCGNSSLNH